MAITSSRRSARALLASGACAFAIAALSHAAPARADIVPPFKGNDTGGIMAFASVAHLSYREVRAIAADHCAQYDKVARIRSVHPRYGDYVSFSCEWRPYGSIHRPIRVAY